MFTAHMTKPRITSVWPTNLASWTSHIYTGGNRLFYVSTPPVAFDPIIQNLGAQQKDDFPNKPSGWQRLIIEKPFGHDLKSAQHLNQILHADWQENQVFRIDHYLGKETVQNLMVMRFANSIFEPIWNYKYIDHVQITVSETVSSDDRAGYYDKSGAMRDMIQNHIFQLLALVAMEPPVSLDATSIRDEKTKVYRAVRPFNAKQIEAMAVRGQYSAWRIFRRQRRDEKHRRLPESKGCRSGFKDRDVRRIKTVRR